MCVAPVQNRSSGLLRRRLKTSTALALVIAGLGSAAVAETLVYDNTFGGNFGGRWTDETNANNFQTWLSEQGNSGMFTVPAVFTSNQDDVIFDTIPLAAGTTKFVNLGNSLKPNSITFDGDGYFIALQSGLDPEPTLLVDDDGLGITVNTGTATIIAGFESDPGTSGDITLDGVGELELRGDSSAFDGDFVVQDGTLIVNGATFQDDAVIDVQAAAMGTNPTLNVNTDTDVDIETAGETVLADGIMLDGTVDVDTGGQFTVTNNNITGVVTNNGGTVDIDGGDFGLQIRNDSGTVNLNGDSVGDRLIRNNGTLNINADWSNDILQRDGTTTLGGDVGGVIDVTGGTLDANSGIVTGLVSVGDTAAPLNATVLAGGSQFDGGLEATAGGTIIVDGDTSGNITNSGGTVTINDTFTLTGIVTDPVSPALNNQSGTTTNNGTINGDVAMAGAATDVFNNNNDIVGNLSLTGGTFEDEADGSASVSGTTTNNGGIINHRGGDFVGGITNNSGTLNLTVSTDDAVTNAGGTIEVSSGAVLSGTFATTSGTTNNAGTINGALSLGGGNTSIINNNSGGVLAGNVNIGGTAVINNNAMGAMNGQVRTTSGTLNAEGGTFAIQIINAGGRVNINEDTTVDLRNESGDSLVANNATLTGNVVVLDGSSTVTGNVDGAVTVQNGSEFNSTGDISGQLQVTNGDVDIDGGQIGTGGSVTRILAGTANIADATFTGGLRVEGGTVRLDGSVGGGLVTTGGATTLDNNFTLSGGATVTTGAFTSNGVVDGGVLQNGGSLTLNGNVTNGNVVSNAGTLNIEGGTFDEQVRKVGGGATLTGGVFDDGYLVLGGGANTTIDGLVRGEFVNNNSTLTINARVDGELSHLSGTTNQAGRVDGVVSIGAGTFNAQDRLLSQVTLNGGTVNADGASFEGALRANAGDVNLDNVNSGTIINRGADVIALADSRFNGNVRNNSGDFVNRGTLDGTLEIEGGEVTNAAQGSVLGAATLRDGGILNASGGSFDGGLRLNGGTFNFINDTSGDISNNGLSVTIGGMQRLAGDFENETGDITHDGIITGRLVVRGGSATMNSDARVNDDFRVNGGTATINGGRVNDGIRIAGGNVDILGDVDADLNGLGGRGFVDSAATVEGRVTVNSGTIISEGIITEDAVVTGSGKLSNRGTIRGDSRVNGGVLNNAASGSLRGGVTLTGGTFQSRGGDIGGQIVNRGGEVEIRRDTDLTGVSNNFGLINAEGTTTINVDRALDGDVRNDATGLIELNGTLNGDLTNRGVVNARGTLNGGLINTGVFNTDFTSNTKALELNPDPSVITGSVETSSEFNVNVPDQIVGSFLNRGAESTVTITEGGILQSRSTVEINGGTLTIDDGGLEGEITFAAPAVVNLNDAQLEGQITSETLMTMSGASSLAEGPRGDGSLTFDGNGQLDVTGGRFFIEGDLNTNENTVLNVAQNATLRAGTIRNRNRIVLGENATLRTDSGAISSGRLEYQRGAQVFGDFRNTGIITGRGGLSFADGLSGGGRVNLTADPGTNDRVRIGGELGNQQFNLNIDLSGDVGQADRIVMTGDGVVTGTVQLDFSLLGEGGEQIDDVVVLQAAPGQDPDDFRINVTGLPNPDDIIVYGASINNDGDVVVFDALNQGISSLAGNIVLAQSLIGSVINRPSSPFVSGLAFEDENPCGVGTWARAIGGQADSSGLVEQTNGDRLSFDGSIQADYYGVQVGTDYACFNGFYDGWDLAFGGIVGANFGQSVQPVFAPDPNAESGLSDTLTSTTDVEFQQTYAGVYVAAVRDALAVDLQYRIEETEFTATNVGADGGPGLGLDGEVFKSNATTLSGAVSYAYPIPETELTLVPTAGFAYSQIETDAINFDDRGRIQIDDFESQTGFVGATLSRTQFGSDGVSALTQFGTVTIYNDFAESPTSTYFPADGGRATTLSTENLGAYGEISAGVNYVRILQPGEFGAAKQFNASVRGDIRVSDRLESWGLTAQARIQF